MRRTRASPREERARDYRDERLLDARRRRNDDAQRWPSSFAGADAVARDRVTEPRRTRRGQRQLARASRGRSRNRHPRGFAGRENREKCTRNQRRASVRASGVTSRRSGRRARRRARAARRVDSVPRSRTRDWRGGNPRAVVAEVDGTPSGELNTRDCAERILFVVNRVSRRRRRGSWTLPVSFTRTKTSSHPW